MRESKVMETATSMISFSTFLGVLFAGLYYFYQIKKFDFFEALVYMVTYININLLFLLFLMRRKE